MTFLYLTTDLKTLFCCDHLSCLRRALRYFPKKKTRQEMEVLFNFDGICGFPCSKKAREEEGSVWGLCGLLKLLKEFPASDQFGWVQVELEFSHPTVLNNALCWIENKSWKPTIKYTHALPKLATFMSGNCAPLYWKNSKLTLSCCSDFFNFWQKGIIVGIHRKWNLFMPSFPLSACLQTFLGNILTFCNLNILRLSDNRRFGRPSKRNFA